ncbi:group II intron reverse transcriptase/maturase [Neobacillus niacini]|uniref:group II intron reverse transcriptase/maturase n=1 Tax=Neobacillus niacini TaxID=86668 RepID=UPI00286244C5|nr:group II intron reverse transcriptase/maturase [Neobacillus niacini]MDR7076792.1 group II intron reverse transcriptase/maturase [Neobacillus niacini]
MSTALRHAEYYGMQDIFDDLYERSKNNATKGLRLYEHIISKDNILLAFRNIKANTGSKTAGTDGITIDQYKIENVDEFIEGIRTSLTNYKPQTVRRVEIPKPNGKKRPLGIPTMRDRLIQQMFKQVLEPICEAKFYHHSYGFRPNRSTHHVMARCQFLVNNVKLYHVVDIDIQGFFDNVSHSILIKQMYSIGIQDKRVLTIVSKMLKAPIKGIGVPTKGTPQGGILSPLLSNIVLNDLDWWIANQWECLKTKHKFTFNNKIRAIKNTNLKQMYIVRYADDFKVFTNSHQSAIRIFHATKGYLKNQLNLDISTEKSAITNLRKRKSDFLGFSLKAVTKRNKYVANIHIMDKKMKNISEKLRYFIREIQNKPTPKTVLNYNAYILGIKNYFMVATHINKDFGKIAYHLMKTMYNRLKPIGKYGRPIKPSETYKRLHKNNFKTYKIAGLYLFPLGDIQTRNAMNFSQDICNYTKEGRLKLYQNLRADIAIEINKMLQIPYGKNRLEFADNRISRYSMQLGKCAVTGEFLTSDKLHCHHKLPRHIGGTDEFSNLVIVHEDVHKLIHATSEKTIERYRNILQLDRKQLRKLNQFRKVCNLIALV